MKKGFTILEIIVLIVILCVLALVAIPMFFTPPELKQEASVRANVSIAASAITSRFALKTGATPEKVARVVAETLNKTTKNPIKRKSEAFTLDSPSEGAVVFVPDNDENFIEVNGYAKDTDNPIITKLIHIPEGYYDNPLIKKKTDEES